MIDFQVAFDKLAQFETADELADFFKSEGVKALPGRAQLCPISHWLKETTQQQEIYTSVNRVTLYAQEHSGVKAKAVPTKAMKDFIYKFDNWEYSDLLATEAVSREVFAQEIKELKAWYETTD